MYVHRIIRPLTLLILCNIMVKMHTCCYLCTSPTAVHALNWLIDDCIFEFQIQQFQWLINETHVTLTMAAEDEEITKDYQTIICRFQNGVIAQKFSSCSTVLIFSKLSKLAKTLQRSHQLTNSYHVSAWVAHLDCSE